MHCGGATSMEYFRVESGLATGMGSLVESRRSTGMGQRGSAVILADGRGADTPSSRCSAVKGSKRNRVPAGGSYRFAIGEARDCDSDAPSGISRGARSVGRHPVVVCAARTGVKSARSPAASDMRPIIRPPWYETRLPAQRATQQRAPVRRVDLNEENPTTTALRSWTHRNGTLVSLTQPRVPSSR
jgi:hypothetical protein